MDREPVETLIAPSAEPITVAKLKARLRLNDASEDDSLAEFITASRELFELTTGRAILPTTFRQFSTAFPVKLQRGKVISVSSVTYYDPTDTLQTLTGWSLDNAAPVASVYLPNATYPALSTKRTRPILVEFVAGWATVGAVPQTIKEAITLLASHYYANREAFRDGSLEELPIGWNAICDQYSTGLTWSA